jgi:hypothetical protein
MWVLDVEVAEEEHSMEGFHEEDDLDLIRRIRESCWRGVPECMPPAALPSLHSPAHKFSAIRLSVIVVCEKAVKSYLPKPGYGSYPTCLGC